MLYSYHIYLSILIGFGIQGSIITTDKDSMITEYYHWKNVNMVVYVTCSEIENDHQTLQAIKKFIENGFSIGVFKKDSNISFTIAPHRHNIGVVLNLACPTSLQVLQQSQNNLYFTPTYYWIIVTQTFENALEKFVSIFISPCSHVLIIHPDQNSGRWMLNYLYKAAANTPLRIESQLSVYHDPVIPKRTNMEAVYIQTGRVIAFPDVFTTIDDLKMRHIDTMARVNHPITANLREDLNFNFNLIQTDNFGWERPNGSFDGLMGRFQRNEIEFGSLALFMRGDRVPIVDFVGDTVRFRACIMFRQPPLSAVTNIFALPFTAEVWFSILVFLIVTTLAMGGLIYYTIIPINMNFMDCLNFTCGAICQQGFYVDIVSRSGRILIFSTFVTTLFLFTSFSANIVALLQSPSETIRTLHDLTLSPLELGVQDTVYNKIYFKESTDPVTKFLYEKKISPKGETIFMRPEIGMQRMRKELFAFQVESQAGYKIISDTYSEPEKCGLMELEPFQLPPMSVPTSKNFPYKELFRQRLRWYREVGLMRREAIRWIPQKPRCEGNMAEFISVGITECRYPLQMLAVGMLCAVALLIGEHIYYRIERKYRSKN